MTPAHILVADDHPLVAGAVEALVQSRYPDTRVTVARDWPSAMATASGDAPGLMLVDADMPGASPLQGIATLRKSAPSAPIILITGLQDDRLLARLLAEGVAGLLPKTAPPELMLAAIALVLAGGRYLPDRMASPPPPALTPRQAEIGVLVAQGLTNKEIARRLAIGPETVKTHVAQLMAILSAANRAEAAVKARALAGGRSD